MNKQQRDTYFIQQVIRQVNEFSDDDIGHVRRKVIRQLSLDRVKNLPSIQDIEQALLMEQQSMNSEDASVDWSLLKAEISQALLFFARFSPKVGGAIARRVWTPSSRTEIYLVADTVEEVVFLLSSSPLEWVQSDVVRTTSDGKPVTISAFNFYANGFPFDLYVLNPSLRLLDPVTGKSQKLLNMTQF